MERILSVLGVILGLVTVVPEQKVCFESKACMRVEVAETVAEKAKGLSGKKFMPQDWGMWFVFDQPQRLAFWMKDMEFGLDFIWLNGKQVVEITERVGKPKTKKEEEKIISPQVVTDGVIEVNAGWVAKHGIEVGDFLVY